MQTNGVDMGLGRTTWFASSKLEHLIFFHRGPSQSSLQKGLLETTMPLLSSNCCLATWICNCKNAAFRQKLLGSIGNIGSMTFVPTDHILQVTCPTPGEVSMLICTPPQTVPGVRAFTLLWSRKMRVPIYPYEASPHTGSDETPPIVSASQPLAILGSEV